METFFVGIITFFASVLGSICGIGGGIIIKPSIDALCSFGVATTTFLASCTVFAMSATTSVFSKKKSAGVIDIATSIPLGVGSAVGGISGSFLFSQLKNSFSNVDGIAALQAGLLIAVIILTIIYTVKKSKISTFEISNKFSIVFVGLSLGLISSFLGIGGGSLNIVALEFFFSFDTKKATQNSLFVIMISQGASILLTVFLGVPTFDVLCLCLMIVFAIFGGAIGKHINSRIESKTIDKLFIILNLVTIFINMFNVFKFL